MEYHWKNLLAMWGLVPASPVSAVNRNAMIPATQVRVSTLPEGFFNDIPWQILLAIYIIEMNYGTIVVLITFTPDNQAHVGSL